MTNKKGGIIIDNAGQKEKEDKMDTEIFVGSIIKKPLEVAEIRETEKGISYVLKVPGDKGFMNRIVVESGGDNASIQD